MSCCDIQPLGSDILVTIVRDTNGPITGIAFTATVLTGSATVSATAETAPGVYETTITDTGTPDGGQITVVVEGTAVVPGCPDTFVSDIYCGEVKCTHLTCDEMRLLADVILTRDVCATSSGLDCSDCLPDCPPARSLFGVVSLNTIKYCPLISADKSKVLPIYDCDCTTILGTLQTCEIVEQEKTDCCKPVHNRVPPPTPNACC